MEKITRASRIKAEKAEKMSPEERLAVAALTGKKADRENARADALGIVGKLLTGQAAGGNRQAAVLALRACMGLEGAPFDAAFTTFKGSLVDVAGLRQWANPFKAARAALASREEAARALGLWIEAGPKFERERKQLDRAEAAKNAGKVVEKAAAFIADIEPFILRAEARLAPNEAHAEADAE